MSISSWLSNLFGGKSREPSYGAGQSSLMDAYTQSYYNQVTKDAGNIGLAPDQTSYQKFIQSVDPNSLNIMKQFAYQKAYGGGGAAYLDWYKGQVAQLAQSFWQGLKSAPTSPQTTETPQAQAVQQQAQQDAEVKRLSPGQGSQRMSQNVTQPGAQQMGPQAGTSLSNIIGALQTAGGPGTSTQKLAGVLPTAMSSSGRTDEGPFSIAPPPIQAAGSPLKDASDSSSTDVMNQLQQFQGPTAGSAAKNLGSALKGYSGLI